MNQKPIIIWGLYWCKAIWTSHLMIWPVNDEINRDPSSNRWSLPQMWMDQNLWNTYIIFIAYFRAMNSRNVMKCQISWGQQKARDHRSHLDLHLVLALSIRWVETPQTEVSRLSIRLALLAKGGPLGGEKMAGSFFSGELWTAKSLGKNGGPEGRHRFGKYKGCEDWIANAKNLWSGACHTFPFGYLWAFCPDSPACW